MTPSEVCAQLGLTPAALHGPTAVRSPIDGAEIARVRLDDTAAAQHAVATAAEAFATLRVVPAPRRGELIRRFGELLRRHKQALGTLISLESGKILQEGCGEVQEMIDICDFAVGLSRQLYGLTIASERPGHRMMETWHPLGPVAAITAFNFPAAVWAWNFALAIVCGDPVLWKPSDKTPLTALACQRLFESALDELPELPPGLSQVLIGGADLGEALARDPGVPLVSATGSCRMGRVVAPIVASRLGRCLLELGGNNAMIVTKSADLALASRAILWSAVGTAGQRCTSLRRLFVHETVYDDLLTRLRGAYAKLPMGSPLDPQTLVGPLIDRVAYERMQAALTRARAEGGRAHHGDRVLQDVYPHAYYVHPAIVEMPAQTAIVCEETFAPILYVMRYRELEQAIALHNAVEQGLSSCIFTSDVREAESFLSPSGSDCGIANVNIGPSGAEIGGAFGGEKATGGGREAGSDAWKSYMRRATNTINYSADLPLAQGIRFGDD
ncbi:MAG: aldehyde dehydrogenase family protein [Polyangiales bacterium]